MLFSQEKKPAQTKANDNFKPSLSVTFSTGCYHITERHFTDKGKTYNFNEFNPGIALEYHFTPKFHLVAGGYKNSFYDPSFYLGGGYETGADRKLGFGVQAGAVTGYEKAGFDIAPLVLPYLRIGKKSARINGKVGVVVSDVPAVTAQIRINL